MKEQDMKVVLDIVEPIVEILVKRSGGMVLCGQII